MNKLIQIQANPLGKKFNLEDGSDRELLSRQLDADIDAWSIATYDDGHRNHLGASIIGHKCERFLWYVFRWCVKEKFNGRMYRLFDRGRREETYIKQYLQGIGIESIDSDDKQIRVVGVGGHFGGSRDGALILHPYGWLEPVLSEFKTQGTGQAFSELKAMGVRNAKSVHWAQMCTYGVGSTPQLRHALYIAVNKNDDDLSIEIVALDLSLGVAMFEKAHRVIVADLPPARISNIPSFYDCKYCAAQQICHFDAPYERNCRSCLHSKPIDNAQWHCGQWNSVIPPDVIPTGCDGYAQNKL